MRMISNSGHLYGSVFALLLFHTWFAQASAEDATTYEHKSGVFSVNATSGNVEESEAEISFTHTMPIAGSITGWDSVSIVKPELSHGRSDPEVINQIVDETFESYYKKVRRRRRPELSVMESVETEVAGRRSWYAKVIYPRLPGTGLTIFDDRGKQVEADFVAHLHLVSVDGLEISQRNLPVKHLLVSSFRAEAFLSNDASDYKNFVDSLSILEASSFVTGKYTGRYGFSFSIPANHAAFGPPFTKDNVQTELIYVFPEGTDPEKLANEKLYGETGVIRFEAIPRIREERTITIDVMQKAFTDRAEGRGEKFAVTQPELSMPAFQITTTQPVSLEQVLIEGRQLLYVITSGPESQLLLHVTQSLEEIYTAAEPPSELENGTATQQVFNKVWYRTAKSSLIRMRAWNAAGVLTVDSEKIEFTSKKLDLIVPIANVNSITLGRLKGDIMNEWARIDYVDTEAERRIGFTVPLGGADDIFRAIKMQMNLIERN